MKIQSYLSRNPYRNLFISLGLVCYGSYFFYSTQLLAQASDAIEDDVNQADNPAGLESTVLYSAIDTANMTPEYNQQGESQPLVIGINQREHEQAYQSETIEATLAPRQQIEIMVNIEQGEVLLYSWQADGKVYYDFHAHQDSVNPDIWIRYADGGNMKSNGSIVAPYTGEHGWYWANFDAKPVTLKLTVSGYYKNIVRHDL